MASKATAIDTTSAALTPEALAAIVRATVEAANASARREDLSPPPSAWNGFGSPDFPKYTYDKVFYCGAEQVDRTQTADEIRLFNQITKPGLYGPDKTWHVTIERNVLHVWIEGINKKEVRLDLPRSLVEILKIIVAEQTAVAA
jgi:hypothetical protein